MHTDSPVTLDLTDILTDVASRSLKALVGDAVPICRDYVRQRGFVSGGELRELDDVYVAALECRYVDGQLAGRNSLTEDERLYLLSLLKDADEGTRPPASAVPRTLRPARGLAVATAVTDYRRTIGEWTTDRSLDGTGRTALEVLGDHATRLDQLDGDVDPETADALLSIARSLGDAIRTNDDVASTDVVDRLDDLSYRG